MRNSEVMGFALYQAYCHLQGEAPYGGWEALDEDEQHLWMKMANIALSHLFENGRIASYIRTPEHLADLSAQYRAYLREKNEPYDDDIIQLQSATVVVTHGSKKYAGRLYAVENEE